MRLFVLGLDGATWDLLDPLIAQGYFPHLQSLLQQGVRSSLQSTYPPVTALAWPAFYTGVNAGKHGVFSFVQRDQQGRQHITGLHQVQAPALWDYLAATDLRLGTLGIPITYPAPTAADFAVSGFLTPPDAGSAFAPDDLEEALQAAVGKWIFHVAPPGHGADAAATRAFVAQLQRETDQKLRAIRWLGDRFQPDVFITVLMHLDTIQHVYWGVLHPQHPHYNRPQSAALRALLTPALTQLDNLIGEIADMVLPNGSLLLLSDHGFGPMYRRLALNNALARHGFLHIHRWRRLRRRLQRRLQWHSSRDARRNVQANPELRELVDWSRTVAFAGAAHELCIHINRRDRFTHGIVEPGDVPAVATAIADMLLGLRDEQGQPLIANVYSAHELFNGPMLHTAPDLFVRPADPRDVVSDGLLRGGRLYRWETHHCGGWHRPLGILLAAGAGIRHVDDWQSPPTLLDIAPTLLALLGYRPPADFDGRILAEMLETPPVALAALPQLVSGKMPVAGLTAEEQAALSERLRGLDYLA